MVEMMSLILLDEVLMRLMVLTTSPTTAPPRSATPAASAAN